MRRSLLLPPAGFALAVAAVVAYPAAAAAPGNLLQNPGAEVPATVVSEGAYTAPAGWEASVPAGTAPRATPYDSCYGGGDTERTVLGKGEASPDGGTRFFFAGQSTPVTLTQTIPVAAADADGSRTLRIGGSFGGFSSQEDAASLTVRYLDAANAVLGTLTTAPVTSAARMGATGWVQRTAAGLVPAGTKSLQAVLTQVRTDGSDNDGYADDLYVTFDAAGPAKQAAGPACTAAPPTTTPTTTTPPPTSTTPVTPPPVVKPKPLVLTNVVTGLPSTKRCLSRRAFRIRLRNPSGTRIASATVRVNGKLVATRKGTRVTAPVDLKGLPKGRYTVKITTRLTDGRTVTGTRKYRTCTPKRR